MNERRPMSQALQTVDLPPGALDFIKAGTPHPVTRSGMGEPAPTPPSNRHLELLAAADASPDPVSPIFSAADRPPNEGTKPRLSRENEPELLPPRNLVNLSIRERPEIPDALLRASTERKLQRLKAHSQQEIAAEALTLWLTRNGYLAP